MNGPYSGSTNFLPFFSNITIPIFPVFHICAVDIYLVHIEYKRFDFEFLYILPITVELVSEAGYKVLNLYKILR